MKETSQNMKKLINLYGIYLPIFLLVLPLTVALRTVALFTDLTQYGHFGNDILITIAGWIVVAATLFFVSYLWLGKKDVALIPSFSSPANYIPAGLVATTLAMLGAHILVVNSKTDLTLASTYTKVISTATPILAFAAVGYFLLSSILIARRSMRRSDFGIITLLFICMYVAYIYFDTSLPINAPTRITDEIAFLGIAMFFLGETRLSLGRESWRRYIAFAFIGATVTAYSAIPNLIYYFARKETLSLSIYESLLTLAFFIFIISKIFLTPMLTKDKNSSIVDKIITAAATRQEMLEPAKPEEAPTENDENAGETDENQITIAYEESTEEEPAPIENDEEKEVTSE